MSPELFSQVASAIVLSWGALTAIRAYRTTTRTGLLGRFLSVAAMLLIVRLVVDFGGWADWFIYVWLVCLASYTFGVYRAATVWPSLPWRAEGAKARRSEVTSLGFSGVLVIVITSALVVPGLLLS